MLTNIYIFVNHQIKKEQNSEIKVKWGKSSKNLSKEDMITLGINPDSFFKLSKREQKSFIQLHALEDSLLFRERKKRKLPSPDLTFKTPFGQILSYLKITYKKPFIFSLFLAILQAFLFLMLPIMLKNIINLLLKNMSEEGLILVYIELGYTAIIIGLLAAIMYIRIYLNNWIGINIIKDLRDGMFKKIQKSTYEFLDKNASGDLISRNTSDINLLKNILSNQIAVFIRQVLLVIFSVAAMFYINFELAIVSFIPIPLIFIIMIGYRRKINPIFKKSRKINGELTSLVQENITGMRVVRAFAQEESEINKFKKKNTEYFETDQKLIFLLSSFEPIVKVLSISCEIIVIYIGAQNILNGGGILIGDLFAFIILINFTIDPLFFISRFLGNIPKVNGASERICKILNNDIEEQTYDLPEFGPINGDVEFKNVFLSYTNDMHEELKDINIKIKAGEQIAILGATGSGKTSLIRLIPQFYKQKSGTILIDGKDITKYNIQSIRKQIGMIPQETFLFGRTIKENLLLGNAHATTEEMIHATKLSDIHDFINNLPLGYDTVLGERGVNLSGGQKQRVAIARALIINPKILILDDATSAVDVDTEYEIQQSFDQMFKGSTIFIITQRLSTVRNADRIIVLDHGKIAEFGTHDNLLKNQEGIYSKLYTSLKVEERA